MVWLQNLSLDVPEKCVLALAVGFGSTPDCRLWRIFSSQRGILAPSVSLPCSPFPGSSVDLSLSLSAPVSSTEVQPSSVASRARRSIQGTQDGAGRDVLSVLPLFLVFWPPQEWTPAVLLFCTPDQLCDQNEKSEFPYLWFNYSFHLQENLLGCPWDMYAKEKWDWGPLMSLWMTKLTKPERSEWCNLLCWLH